jgi:succinate dehydrogenase/fumarate reductase cytochrome b subunit
MSDVAFRISFAALMVLLAFAAHGVRDIWLACYDLWRIDSNVTPSAIMSSLMTIGFLTVSFGFAYLIAWLVK